MSLKYDAARPLFIVPEARLSIDQASQALDQCYQTKMPVLIYCIWRRPAGSPILPFSRTSPPRFWPTTSASCSALKQSSRHHLPSQSNLRPGHPQADSRRLPPGSSSSPETSRRQCSTPSHAITATFRLNEVTPDHDASSCTSIWHIRGLKLGALQWSGGRRFDGGAKTHPKADVVA